MDVADKIVVITGAGSGIGAAIAHRMSAAGARVVVTDRDLTAAQKTAAACEAVAYSCDVGEEKNIQYLIERVTEEVGAIDVFVSNAGFGKGDPSHAASASDEMWDLNWRIHVMAHVWAARALLPGMLDRGSGYFMNVCSAAGLLNQIGDAAYSATKHAAVSFAESLAITHGYEGIGVSVVCPQYVATPLIGLSDADVKDHDALKTADEVAVAAMTGIGNDQFLILPHEKVAQYTALRSGDHDRWITGMQKLRKHVLSTFGDVDVTQMYKLV